MNNLNKICDIYIEQMEAVEHFDTEFRQQTEHHVAHRKTCCIYFFVQHQMQYHSLYGKKKFTTKMNASQQNLILTSIIQTMSVGDL